ncbi:hypothetical protein [Paenibacillus prosopidis]|uniref:hypothetical protein n=1 Tax=Paenibacillus prosopidis TaxID=630520 RepID=UPI0015F19618|nr:hypothetical protein [Paenibacillus prosopidis]
MINQYNALVIPNDVRVASEAVQKLIKDKTLRQHLQAGGCATILKWGWDRSIDLLERR